MAISCCPKNSSSPTKRRLICSYHLLHGVHRHSCAQGDDNRTPNKHQTPWGLDSLIGPTAALPPLDALGPANWINPPQGPPHGRTSQKWSCSPSKKPELHSGSIRQIDNSISKVFPTWAAKSGGPNGGRINRVKRNASRSTLKLCWGIVFLPPMVP